MTKTRLETKFFEVRDTGTLLLHNKYTNYMGVIAIKSYCIDRDNSLNKNTIELTENEASLPLKKLFTFNNFIFINLDCGKYSPQCQYDADAWEHDFQIESHKYIEENFDKLESGSVIDIHDIIQEENNNDKNKA